jgi:hypothetical protein
MKGLLVIWIVVRISFEAVVWATLVWTASESFYPIEWISLFWVFFAILFILGLKVMGAEPWLAGVMLVTDPMLVGMAVLQAVMCALIPTVITIVVANLISSWTHMVPDWLHVFLFFGCGFYILWRRNGKQRAVQAWKGGPKPEWKTSDLFKGPSPVEHLPEWQREKLMEHRNQRSSLKVEEGQGVWTRAPDRSLVTELELYWAQVSPFKNNKIGFAVYSKKSGQMAQSGYDYDTEKQAIDAASAWMRHGKSPDLTGDFRAEPATEKQPENARLQTERDLVKAISLGASKSTKRIVDFIPEGKQEADLTIKIYLEYLCFFLHVTNRQASKVGSYQEVNEMYNTITPLVIGNVIHEVWDLKGEKIPQTWTIAIRRQAEAREIQYAESKEYASKEWKPLSGTSTVDMLVRNIRELADTYYPEELFQIQLAARESMHESKLLELIANYRKAHPSGN